MISVTRTPQPQILQKNAERWLAELKIKNDTYQIIKIDKDAKKEEIGRAHV